MRGMTRVVSILAICSCLGAVAMAQEAATDQEAGFRKPALHEEARGDGLKSPPLQLQNQEKDGGVKPLHANGPALRGSGSTEAGPLQRPTEGESQEKRRQAAALQKAHVLVLGSFHMANPGHDIFNLKVDDVLTEKRQKEIAETVAALKKFRPTKIAIESDPGGKRPQQYQDYLDGKYTLTRNEIDQLGFRLAKELGHRRIYPIDADGDFPFDKVVEFAKKNGKQKELDEWMAAIPKLLDKESEILKNGTISDLLLFMNREQQVREDQEYYMDFAQFADGKDFPGPDLQAEWYRRNARIFANLRGIIESSDERVLVIYGSGHLYWLQRDVLDSRDLELERFGEYAGKKE